MMLWQEYAVGDLPKLHRLVRSVVDYVDYVDSVVSDHNLG